MNSSYPITKTLIHTLPFLDRWGGVGCLQDMPSRAVGVPLGWVVFCLDPDLKWDALTSIDEQWPYSSISSLIE